MVAHNTERVTSQSSNETRSPKRRGQHFTAAHQKRNARYRNEVGANNASWKLALRRNVGISAMQSSNTYKLNRKQQGKVRDIRQRVVPL